MKKRRNIIAYLLIMLILSIIALSVFFLKPTGFAVKELEKQVQFYFYDELTNCSLNGYLFIGEVLIGRTDNGSFNLTLENYEKNFQNPDLNISIFGKLGECFNEPDLFFDKSWKSFEIDGHYFEGDSLFVFKAEINIHNPVKKEFLGFIQPNDMNIGLNTIIERGDVLADLSELNKYLNTEVAYKKDWEFGKENYWQTPEETLKIKTGDCEDFSAALLSLFLAYDPALKCYNIVFSTHVTTFCNIADYYAYYDQQEKEIEKQIKEKDDAINAKAEISDLNKEYSEYYGIDSTETRAYYAFNNMEYFEFKRNEDFIDWQYSLLNKNIKTDILRNLDYQFKNPGINPLEINPEETGQLATQKMTQTNSKSFPYWAIGLLIIVIAVIILVVILIIMKKKS